MSGPDAEPALSSDNSATSPSPQPPGVESKEEVHDIGSNAPVTRLPDEILDWIIKDLKADPNGLRLPFGTGVQRFKNADMLSCSLVCQRWRRIALPYLFHRYRLVDFWGDCHDALEDLSDDEDNIFNFLSEAETITPLIRELIFDSSILPLSSLSCFLTLLPRLQSVEIARTPIVGCDECVDRGETFRIDRVKFFPSSGEDNRLRDYAVNLLELLTLFSEIGTLCLSGVGLSDEDYRGRDEDEDEDVDHSSRIVEAVKRSLVQGLIIRGLHLNQSKYMDIYRAVLCSHPDILMHVVCLELTGVGFEIREYGTITSLLSLLGPKLRELTLNFRWLWNDPWFSKGLYYLVSNIKDEILGLLKDPLSACTSLHALRLSMSSSITLSHTQSLEDRNATAVEFAVEDWTLLVRMIDAVRSEKLTHVALCFWQEVDLWSDHEYCSRDFDFHGLPWSMLQDACRSHGKLESIAISFAEDERKNDEHVGLQCIREHMKEFKEAIALGESGNFDMCRERTCPWYKP